MSAFVTLLLSLLGLYIFFCIAVAYTWQRLPTFQMDTAALPKTLISVIIVIRNEEAHIAALLEDLLRQHYPYWEAWVLDDGSDDQSPDILQQYTAQHPQIHYLRLPPHLGQRSPKKEAVSYVMPRLKGSLIACTDGDCRIPSADWLGTLAAFQAEHQACFISGAVTFEGEKSLFERIQTVEFASLVVSGAATMVWGQPTMCNGANMAYLKEAFEAVGGYEGLLHVASGDDELLMHRMAERFPGKVLFLKSSDNLLHTYAQKTWQGFYRQRLRWSSKWEHYRPWGIRILAVFIFLANMATLAALPLALLLPAQGAALLGALLAKLGVEFYLLSNMLRFLGKRRFSRYIPFVFVLYPFYVFIFALLGRAQSYQWKNRNFKKSYD